MTPVGNDWGLPLLSLPPKSLHRPHLEALTCHTLMSSPTSWTQSAKLTDQAIAALQSGKGQSSRPLKKSYEAAWWLLLFSCRCGRLLCFAAVCSHLHYFSSK